MRFLRFLKVMATLTVLAVVYIHLQIQIIKLAYNAKNKEQQIQKLLEEQGRITYEILTLKSANHLGVKLLNDKSDMKFLDHSSIVKVETPEIVREQIHLVTGERVKKPNLFASIFSLRSQAEAKPVE